MYKLNQQVLFQMKRCACVGGGTTELIGTVVGKVADGNGDWYQISTPSGIQYTRECDILKVYG